MKALKANKKPLLPFYVTRRANLSKPLSWAIRIGGILIAFLFAGIICSILSPGSFFAFFENLGKGCFDFTKPRLIVNLLASFSILLLIATALTPAFKMRYWNIGVEGQILMGCMAAAGVARFAPSDMPNALILVLALFASMLGSCVWAIIPSIFKAFFNTNETLFTLMLNYVAAIVAGMMISFWAKDGSQSFGVLTQGIFPSILPDYFKSASRMVLVIPIALVLFVGLYFFIEKSKIGYELSIIGQSRDTATYVGINFKKTTIITLGYSGLIFGIIGFLIVCGINYSFNSTIVGGQGFTGVLIAWLGHFQPGQIALYAFLSAVMNRGTTYAASQFNISSAQFSAICTGVFFFVIIACEFFSSYRINLRHKEKEIQAEVIEQ